MIFPTLGLIDGILADDSGFNVYTGVSEERLQQRYEAKHTLLQEMQVSDVYSTILVVMSAGRRYFV